MSNCKSIKQQEIPKFTRNVIKRWDETRNELYVNGMLYEVITEFHRKDAFGNIYEFGKRKQINHSKIKIPVKSTSEIQRLDPETITVVWIVLYSFSILFPLFSTLNGWFSQTDLWWMFVPFYISLGLFCIMTHEKWSRKITHHRIVEIRYE